MPQKSASKCVATDSSQRADMIHDLDIKYRRITHDTELLIKDEDSRRLRLRSMVLRDETGSLKEVLAKRDARIKALAEQADDARVQLDSVQDKCRRQEKIMQTQSREIANLKAEMSALGSVSQDSAKMLSEKLAMSRELAVLKPEMEHLRSQLAHQKDVLAEKLALERQLNALEVELANEKRAAQKAARKQDQESEEEAELRRQVQDLEKQLAKEKKAAQKTQRNQENKNSEAEDELETLREQLAEEKRGRDALQKKAEALQQRAAEAEKELAAEKRGAQRKAKNQDSEEGLAELQERVASLEELLADEKKEKARMQKEHAQAISEAEAQQAATDTKLERLRTKLRATQEELKQCRADLEKAKEHSVSIPKVTTSSVPLKKPAAKVPLKKRTAVQAGLEPSILHTPGQDDRTKRPLKKRGFDPSAVEKSTFSITPFLNKTVNLSDESLKVGEENTRTVPVLQFRSSEDTSSTAPTSVEPAASEPEKEAEPVEKKARGRPKGKPLADAAPSKKNLTARTKAPVVEPVLEKVAEEEAEEASGEQENRSMESSGTTAKTEVTNEAEPKKKKRKLLGTANKPTLFEDDEGERVAPVKRPAKTALGGGVRTKTALGGVRNAFAGASFSPLKRDRRGVGASFLA